MEIVKETVTSGVQMTFIGYSRNMVPGTEFGARQALIQLIYVEWVEGWEERGGEERESWEKSGGGGDVGEQLWL